VFQFVVVVVAIFNADMFAWVCRGSTAANASKFIILGDESNGGFGAEGALAFPAWPYEPVPTLLLPVGC